MRGFEVVCSLPDLGQIGNQAFDPYVILSPQNDSVLYFSQAFAQISRFHPSTGAISKSMFRELDLELKKTKLNVCYEILQCVGNKTNYRTSWIDAIIHELRTASLAISLGAYAFALDEEVAPLILSKILQASHRQKISTLIASDLIQLLTTPPETHPISLARILKESLSRFPPPIQINFSLGSLIKIGAVEHIHPFILGNQEFLEHFFGTIFSWLEMEEATVEMEIINPVTVKVSIRIPNDQFLTNIQGFYLISHYIEYVIGYFNGRSWLDQTSINIMFPLCENRSID
jgi:hypothetical protein